MQEKHAFTEEERSIL